MDKEHNNYFDSANLLVFLYKWYKLYLGIIVLSVLLSAVFSAPYFIPPQYKSVVIMFPTASNSRRPTDRADVTNFKLQYY